jgi:putative membrane protein
MRGVRIEYKESIMHIRSIGALLFAAALGFASQAGALEKKDSKFFEKAASAGQLEVEAGRLAARSATDPQLKAFGQKMATDHAQADSELRALAARKGISLPVALSKSDQKSLDKLRDEKPGKDFDNEFRDLMVDSHKEAVSLFQGTAKSAKDPEVKAFAARMLPKLQQHESEAKALEKEKM